MTALLARTNDTLGQAASPPRVIRVFLADDHAVFREGLRALITSQFDVAVVGEAETGAKTLAGLAELGETNVDVLVLDISMPDGNGIEVAEHIRRESPKLRVLALTMHEDKSYLRSMLESRVSGYVLKHSAAEELIRAIRVVANGGTYLDSSLSATAAESLTRAPGLRGELYGARLSEREADVLRLIAQGFTNKEIGVKLAISVKTVETYKARSMEKLGLDSRVDIVRYALQRGWLTPSG